MIKQVTVLGDMTNYGGRIITASGQGYCGMDGVALLGDLVSCPKCSSTGRIIEGANDFIIDGKPVAYDGCIVACKCTPIGGHKILALNSTIFVGVSGGSVQSNSFAGNQKQLNSANDDENNLIRIDARVSYNALMNYVKNIYIMMILSKHSSKTLKRLLMILLNE